MNKIAQIEPSYDDLAFEPKKTDAKCEMNKYYVVFQYKLSDGFGFGSCDFPTDKDLSMDLIIDIRKFIKEKLSLDNEPVIMNIIKLER